MLQRIFVVAIAAVALRAQTPSNAVTITERTAAAQSNRPFTISRVFARGEIAHFAQAVIGTTPAMTQCDVKTRWPDGSVQHALISFLANLPASGTITVSFRDQASGNNTGQLDKAGMLAANWGARIEVTNGTTLTADARTILNAWAGTAADKRVTYWLQGSICTQVIFEDRSTALAYDMGWDAHKPLHPIFVVTFYAGYIRAEMILENDWTTKLEDQTYSLAVKVGNPPGAALYSKANYVHLARSRWRKTFWSGPAPGAVSIDYNLAYMAHSQAVQNWDLTKVVPASATNNDINSFNNSDQGPASVAAANDLGKMTGGAWNSGHGMWTQYIPQTGARSDIGVFPQWYVRYLYTMQDPNVAANMYNMFLGQAQVSGYLPSHLRESATNKFFDSGHTVNAFGKTWSLDGRPTLYIPNYQFSGVAPADTITPVGPISTGGWVDDIAHEPDFAYLPYLITGDWYWLEEIYFHASNLLGYPAPGFSDYERGGAWGYFAFAIQTRGQGWGLRNVAHAAFAAPDGTPEKAYFTQKLNNNIQIEEGNHNVLAGAFPPANASCPNYSPGPNADKWCFGRRTVGGNAPNPLHVMNKGDYGVCNPPDPRFVAQSDPYGCSDADSPWMMGYKFAAVGHIQELGFQIGPLNAAWFLSLLHQILDPAFNPWLTGEYRIPARRANPAGYYQTWADMLLVYSTAYHDGCGNTINLRTAQEWTMNRCGGGDADATSPGYPHIVRGASSYLATYNINDGTLLGADAWKWMEQHVDNQGSVGNNPQFALLPRTAGTPTPPSASCDLNKDSTVNLIDAARSITGVLGLTACGASLTGTGQCSLVDTQRIVLTVLGATCRVGP